jgi:hypothetical protein
LRSLSHLHAPAPHPCRLPRSGPAPSRGTVVASNYPSRRIEPCDPTRHYRGRCVSPMSATDLRHEHPANRTIPGFASTSLAARFVRPPAAGATGFTWVEHRLTATLQLRLSTPIVSRRKYLGLTPGMARTRYRSVLAGAAIDGPSGDIPRPRCSLPRAELANVASDAPCRIRRSPARLAPHRHSRLGFRLTGLRRTPDPLPPPSRQRRLLPPARAPSIDECSLRPLAQTSQRTRHRLTTLPSRSGFRRPFAPSPLSGERLDPPPSGDRPGAARRLLQSPRSTSTTDRIV